MRRKLISGLCVVFLLALGGCGNTIPELTEEEERQIVNYAADIALQYDASYEERLVEISSEDEEIAEIPLKPTQEPSQGMDPVKDTDTVDVSEEKNKESYTTMEEFYGIQGVEIQFADAFFTDTYPKEGMSDYFSLDPAEGKTFLVMQFAVSNRTAEDAEVDFLEQITTLRVSFNGEKMINVLSTMLDNDLSNYSGTVKAGETMELVLLAEVAKESVAEVQTLELTMKNESGSAKISLK